MVKKTYISIPFESYQKKKNLPVGIQPSEGDNIQGVEYI